VIGRDDVVAAAERLRGKVVRTPVLRCAALDALAGAELYLKAENLQYVGAFKARGAQHAVARLSDAERARGVITYSSGNHAQAVALAAMRHGIDAEIFMPVDAPPIKRAAVEAMSATVELIGTTSTERHAAAVERAGHSGAVIIEPFDHPDTVAGQGTATLELLDEVGTLDALVVPVGGGGLIAGACLACEGTATRIYAAEPAGCDAMGQSLAAGERVTVDPGPTLGDGLKPSRVGELNFAIARERLAGSFTVDDDELGRTLVRLLMWSKVLVEPSGAAALAVALRGDIEGDRIGVLLSGGNIGPEQLRALTERYPV
jgi:threonine dehydratase